MELKGIDVSHHNGKLDWNKIKNDGVQFAIIRTGFGKAIPSQKDREFDRNYTEAKRVGIPIGAYHYSYATTVEEAREEADFVLDIIRGKQFEYPIYFDIEDEVHTKLSKKACSDIVKAFCTRLEENGYWCGVYSFDAFFKSSLTQEIQKRYAIWVARVENVKPSICKTYQMWQYSWKGKVKGSSAETDMDICYVDYPSMIKKAKKNGYGSVTYKLTASKTGLTASEALSLETKLKSLGFSVTKAVQ